MSTSTVPLPGWPGSDGPNHEGEAALQDRAGVRARIAAAGRRVVRDFMPDQHRRFFEALPFLVVGSLDANIGIGLLRNRDGVLRVLRVPAVAIAMVQV